MTELSATPKKPIKIGIVIVTYNAMPFVKICIESIKRYTTVPYELIIVDNDSEDPLREYLKTIPDATLILNEDNKLWAAGCNQGMQAAGDDVTHILLLNSDIEIRRADWLQRLVAVAEASPETGMVGTKQNFIYIWPTFGSLDGECLLIKKTLIDEIGLLDSERFPWSGSPIDYAAKAFQKGYRYKLMPSQPELLTHYNGKSIDELVQTSAPAIPKPIDFLEIIKESGLRAYRIPKILCKLYRALPEKPFYRLNHKELALAKGKNETRKTFYTKYMKNSDQ